MFSEDNKINTLPFNIQVQVDGVGYNHRYIDSWHTTITDGGIKPIFDWVKSRVGSHRKFCIILDKSKISDYYKLPKSLTDGVSVLFVEPSKWFPNEKLMLVNNIHHIDVDYEIDWSSTLCQYKSHTELYNAMYWRTYHKLLDSGISNDVAKERAFEATNDAKIDSALRTVLPDNTTPPKLVYKAKRKVY